MFGSTQFWVKYKVIRCTFICFGEYSCSYTNIFGGEYLYGHGPFSLRNSIIESNLPSINIGYLAGYNTTIICNNNCSINCFDNACFNTYYHCESGNCNININCDTAISSYCPFNIANITDVSLSPTLCYLMYGQWPFGIMEFMDRIESR